MRSPFPAFSIACFAPIMLAAAPANPEVSRGETIAAITATSIEEEQLDAQVRSIMAENEIPAVSFAVVNSKGLVLSKAYGESRPGEEATSMTMFNIASVTKFLAAEAVLQLADQGLFSIDDTMAPVFVDPDVAQDPRSGKLTVRHALSHQTGFPNWRFMTDDKKLAFTFDPGARPGYSGEGYNYVARYASNLTELSFPELLEARVFAPAQASMVGFKATEETKDHFAWSRKGDGSFTPADTQDWSAADDLYASPADLGKVVTRMLADGTLSEPLEKQRRTIQFDMAQQFCARPGFAGICPKAVGFTLTGIAFEYDSETVYWQGGGDVGERAVLFMVPERDLGVIILTNGAKGARVFAPIAKAFYDNTLFTDFLVLQGQQ